MVLKNPVDHHHDYQRGKDRKNADRKRSNADVDQRASLLDHHAGDPTQSERSIGFGPASRRPQEHRFPIPDFAKAQFVHGDCRRALRRVRILEKDHLLLDIGAGLQPGRAIGEQEHNGSGVLEAKQVAPTNLHRARPHAGALGPSRQRGRGNDVFAGRSPQFFRIEFDPLVTRRLDCCLEAGMPAIGARGQPMTRLGAAIAVFGSCRHAVGGARRRERILSHGCLVFSVHDQSLDYEILL